MQSRRPRYRIGRRELEGVESNSRLTATVAAVLLVLLAAEGITLLRITQLVDLHVFIGMLLVPPILLKMGSTGWRFTRYYIGSPAYVRKGPPAPLLRLLGPVIVVLTVILLASGIALIAVPASMRLSLLFIHKASFVLWFFAMVVHVLGHIRETAHLAPLDYVQRTRHQISRAGARTWAVAISLVLGLVIGIMTYGDNGGFNLFYHHAFVH